LAFNIPGFFQALKESTDHGRETIGRSTIEKSDDRHRRLLRTRGKRQKGPRASHQIYEIAPSHIAPETGIVAGKTSRLEEAIHVRFGTIADSRSAASDVC